MARGRQTSRMRGSGRAPSAGSDRSAGGSRSVSIRGGGGRSSASQRHRAAGSSPASSRHDVPASDPAPASPRHSPGPAEAGLSPDATRVSPAHSQPPPGGVEPENQADAPTGNIKGPSAPKDARRPTPSRASPVRASHGSSARTSRTPGAAPAGGKSKQKNGAMRVMPSTRRGPATQGQSQR